MRGTAPSKSLPVEVFLAAVASVEPGRLLADAFRREAETLAPAGAVGRVVPVGGGKAGRPMAQAALDALSDLVVTGPTGTNVTDIAVGVSAASGGGD